MFADGFMDWPDPSVVLDHDSHNHAGHKHWASSVRRKCKQRLTGRRTICYVVEQEDHWNSIDRFRFSGASYHKNTSFTTGLLSIYAAFYAYSPSIQKSHLSKFIRSDAIIQIHLVVVQNMSQRSRSYFLLQSSYEQTPKGPPPSCKSSTRSWTLLRYLPSISCFSSVLLVFPSCSFFSHPTIVLSRLRLRSAAKAAAISRPLPPNTAVLVALVTDGFGAGTSGIR